VEGYDRLETHPEMLFERRESTAFVAAHQMRVADYIYGNDCRQPSLLTLQGVPLVPPRTGYVKPIRVTLHDCRGRLLQAGPVYSAARSNCSSARRA